MDVARASEIDALRLTTLCLPVRKLQKSLHAKAKAEPSYRFYSLWDKMHRNDVLAEAYQLCRANRGAAGADGETFADIEAQGVDFWLGNLLEELRTKRYAPGPLLRVWIPKSNGGRRPLSIPSIRDRVAQMAAHLVLGPIFEADLLPQQYGFRPGVDAKMAIRRVFFHITQHGRREIVDGDLSDYFGTIPHSPLLRCLVRRVSDGQVVSVVKQWLRTPVVEREGRRYRRTTEARDSQRGVPQGGCISPLMANLYFRRFLLAWEKFGYARDLDAQVVNYADDLVICCKPGNGPAAMTRMRELMDRVGLRVNEQKTHLVSVPEERFNFLGYTIGRFYGKDGRPYIGTCPSRKAVSRLLRRIHDETSTRWVAKTVESRVTELNQVIRGWCGYFNQGPVQKTYYFIRAYTEKRLRRWLMKKRQRRGTGYRQYPDAYLYEKLGLYKPVVRRVNPSSAKA